MGTYIVNFSFKLLDNTYYSERIINADCLQECFDNFISYLTILEENNNISITDIIEIKFTPKKD